VSRRLLIVEDNDQDYQAILRSLDRVKAEVAITRCIDGDSALELLRDYVLDKRNDKLPEIILLDLNLPGIDGRDFLAEVKEDEILRVIPVVVMSNSTSPTDVATCYRLGASGYCVKPIDHVRFDQTIAAMHEYWLRSVMLPERAYLS
jgi:CheY-like chemotaxis protein